MKVIPPLEITDSILVSSSCVEDPIAINEWDAFTTYIIGDEVKVTGLAGAVEIYESLIDDNLDMNPASTAYSAYSGITTYANGDHVIDNYIVYMSLAGSNTNHNPLYSPTWWQAVWFYEDDAYLAWLDGHVYTVGDRCLMTSTHRVYECLIGHTASPTFIPNLNTAGSTPKWLDYGPTDRWAMFDLIRNTKSQDGSPLVVKLMPGARIDACALVNTNAESVEIVMETLSSRQVTVSGSWNLGTGKATIYTPIAHNMIVGDWVSVEGTTPFNYCGFYEITDAGSDWFSYVIPDPSDIITVQGTATKIVYRHSASLAVRDTTTWYTYFFSNFDFTPSMVLFDIPPYSDGIITITQTRFAGRIQCGACVIGQAKYLGSVQQQATNETLNFSSVTRDILGNATMVQRRNVPKTNQQLFVYNTSINSVRRIRDDLNAIPAVWSGLDDVQTSDYFEALLILGFYRTFTITMDNPLSSTVQLELEEV